ARTVRARRRPPQGPAAAIAPTVRAVGMSDHHAGDALLTTTEAARYLGISPSWLTTLVDRGVIPLTLLVGRPRLVRRRDPAAWHPQPAPRTGSSGRRPRPRSAGASPTPSAQPSAQLVGVPAMGSAATWARSAAGASTRLARASPRWAGASPTSPAATTPRSA